MRVAGVLDAHPIISGRCGSCARRVCDVGLEVDPSAHCLSVRPAGREPFVAPKADLGDDRWYYHFTAHVSTHCVDVLTSTMGTPRERYLEAHWKYPDALRVVEEEPEDE